MARPGGCARGGTAAALPGIEGFAAFGRIEINVAPNENLPLPGVIVTRHRCHEGPDTGLELSREHALLAAGWLLIRVDPRLPPARQFPAIERAVRDRRGNGQRRRSLAG